MNESDALKNLFKIMREHPGFNELITRIPPPTVPRFTSARLEDGDRAYIEWIFKSAKREHHNQWMSLLTGKQGEL